MDGSKFGILSLEIFHKPHLVSIFENSKLFLLIIKLEIVKELGGRPEASENHEHLFTNFGEHFLAVTSLASRSVLIERIFNVDELGIGNILNLNPFNADGAWPLVLLLPEVLVLFSVVHSGCHPGDSAKVL